MRYEEFILKMRDLVPKEYLKPYTCQDKALLVQLIDTSKKGYEVSLKAITDKKDDTIYGYAKGGKRTIHSLARTIIKHCSPSAFSNFLNEVDNEDTGEDGELSRKLVVRFRPIIPDINEMTAADDVGNLFFSVIKDASERSSVRNNKEGHAVTSCDSPNSHAANTQAVPAGSIVDPLLYDFEEKIKEYSPLFVATVAYKEAFLILVNFRRLLVVGAPGAGKSITSYMVVERFRKMGYALTVCHNMDNLKEVALKIASDPNRKELVFIDDCLGQAYMALNEAQENDLTRLVKTVLQCKDKCIVLNSRVYIINKQRGRQSLIGGTLNDFYKSKAVLSVDNLSKLEKAQILYNHLLQMRGITNDFYLALQKDKRYIRIIEHDNYSPRIIWQITQDFFLEGIRPEEYFDKVIWLLDHPDLIWDEEYNNRLSKTDRLILTSLFSLTSEKCDFEILKTVYYKRISIEKNLDTTIDYWGSGLKVLNGSMISISFSENKRFVSVINPSVNDYLRQFIVTYDSNECALLKNCIIAPLQITRLYGLEGATEEFKKRLIDKSILDLEYDSDRNRGIHISTLVSKHLVCCDEYKPFVRAFLNGEYYSGSSPYAPRGSLQTLVDLIRAPKVIAFYLGGIEPKKILSGFMQVEGVNPFCRLFSAVYSNPQFFDLAIEENYDFMIECLEQAVFQDFVDVGNELIPYYEIDLFDQYSFYQLSDMVNDEVKAQLLPLSNDNPGRTWTLPDELMSLIEETIRSTDVDFKDELKQQYGNLTAPQKRASVQKPVNEDLEITKLFSKAKIK